MNHKETLLPDDIFNNIKSYIAPKPQPAREFPLKVGKKLVLKENTWSSFCNKIHCDIMKVEHIKTEKYEHSIAIGGITKIYKVKVKITQTCRNTSHETKTMNP